MGAEKIVGIDISKKMLESAKAQYNHIDFRYGDIENLNIGEEKFDVVFSSLTMHYIDNFEKLIKSIYEIIENKGYLIFSQEHPLSTAPLEGMSWGTNENQEVTHYKLSDYSRSGKRSTTWFVDDVIKYHRTFGDIINVLVSSGFKIEKVIETMSTPAGIHKPNFLVIKASKNCEV